MAIADILKQKYLGECKMIDEEWIKMLEEAIQLIDKARTQLKKVQIAIATRIVREKAKNT